MSLRHWLSPLRQLSLRKLRGVETSVDEKKSTSEDAEVRENGDGDAELLLYPITVEGPTGEKLELQVNPGDSVMDLRQFLLDAPETCFYTCYDLILNSAEGVRYHLAEYLEIREVADITAGGCSLEMINGKARLGTSIQQPATSSRVNPTGASLPGQLRPRGALDESAARAVNEARKKAAARGPQVRPQAASVPPLGDLLSLINSGAPLINSTTSSSTPRLAGKKTTPKSANGPVEAADDPSPVGLGNGLGGLESKKQKKSKSKNAA